MGSQVPVWIPILVAFFGLSGVVVTQVLASRREARRLREESEREERRWRRERDARTYEARSAAYAQLVSAFEAFDMAMYSARLARLRGLDLDPADVAELREVRGKVRESFGPAVLLAPEEVRRLIQEAGEPRFRHVEALLATDADKGALRSEWDEGQRQYRLLRRHMRIDLGLDAEAVEDIDRDSAARRAKWA
ncbi:hypothetical protein [Pseudonocardia acaciae]|uniref:hypothetical protein n=1 Tax=Pseudonocardia acaciae TaxID=551276 RepID=UPI0006872379|nr:hypothetical protein [Pseudonocardia acaciae]